MRRSLVVPFVLLLLIGGMRLAQSLAYGAVENGAKAPGFTLKNHDGADVSLANYAGKIVVLEWFNDGCPVSAGHHKPDKNTMVNTAAKYADKGVVWLAVNSTRDHDVAHNAKAAAKFAIAYPILDDSAGAVGKAYGAKVTPHLFVIDATGAIAYQGAIDDQGDVNYVDQAIAELLAGKTVSVPQTKPYGCGIKYAK